MLIYEFEGEWKRGLIEWSGGLRMSLVKGSNNNRQGRIRHERRKQVIIIGFDWNIEENSIEEVNVHRTRIFNNFRNFPLVPQ